MITCPSCGKRNQDHYKFCLACGAELPRSTGDDSATKGMPAFDEIVEEETTVGGTGDEDTIPTPPVDTGESSEEEPAGDDGDAAAATPVDGVECAECGYTNPPNNRFCSGCGNKLDAAPTPAKNKELSGIALIALSPEGGEIGTFALPKGTIILGRDTGGIFKDDRFLSPKHASFRPEGRRVKVADEGSLNGVFRKLVPDQRYILEPGQMFRIGQELIRYDALDEEGADEDGVDPLGAEMDDYIGRISLVIGRDTAAPAYPVTKWGINLGRERGHVLFGDDGYVSGLHCRLTYEDGRVFITDLGSSNGTFLRLLDEEWVTDGDVLLMGQQLFKVTTSQ